MARGWESKSIESQQEEAVRQAAKPAAPPTSAEREQRARRTTLELARARAASDLARASGDAHRAMLERTLAALDEEIGRL